MKKYIFTLLLVTLSVVSFGQQWVAINSDTPSTIQTTLVSSSEDQITVSLRVPGFYAFEVNTPRGEANIISVPKTVSTAQAGEPNLPMIAVPAIIGDRQHYSIRVIEVQYMDYPMEVAPSKGDFPRSINPDDVPYTYGEAYATNAFFPTQNVGLYEPYILRDFRGQNMVFYPFAYNPVSKTLRVYYNMTVEMYSNGLSSENILDRRSSEVKMDPEFDAIYANQFINYHESMGRYTPMVETGELLIICHDDFMNAMQPFVNWKKQIGRPTTMVGTSTAGANYTAIKSYIQSQYSANNNLTHVLLVGDVGQIPGNPYSAGSYGGKSDNIYGQIAGNDLYNDIIIGRFSAENETHVTTQVNKVIHYERDINASDTWLVKGCGVAAHAGNGGHFSEDDWQHINNIRTDLLNYNYSTVYQEYYGTSGYSSTTQQISDRVNSGVSIINYCNHGSQTAWQSHSPHYSNSYVNALTNDNMLPIIWSVACLNGQYDYTSQPCFAETWMRATNNSNGNPTGAIGGMFSYISQPWVPPMYGQDEMVDVLVETYNNNIKRTLGGCSYDGNMKILDQYGETNNPAKGTYLAWILYGDPTLTLRNAVPTNMNVTHAASMATTATSFTVNATNGEGALATLTRNNEIMGSATINNGTCEITFAAPETTGTATLTVFGYNKITYIGTVEIVSGGPQNYTISVSANPSNGGTVNGGGTFQEGQQCSVSAIANNGYEFTNWTENGIAVSNEASYTFTVNGNRTLVANFTVQPQQFTIAVSANPIAGGRVSGDGTYYDGEVCTVTATANSGYTFIKWTENGEEVSNEANYTFTVTSNRTLVAQFQAQTYTITASANPSNGGNVTGGGTFNYGQRCTLTAIAATGYDFIKWTKNGQQVSTNANYTFTVTESATFVAHFQVQSFTITATANPTEGGTVTGGGSYSYGGTCTVSATTNNGFVFTSWSENGNGVCFDSVYTFVVTSSRNLVANYRQEFLITATADPENYGTVSGGGYYSDGQTCTLVATPAQNRVFVKWTKDGEQVSTNATYQFSVHEAGNYVAHFETQRFNITTINNGGTCGSVSGGGSYEFGQTCTITATPNPDDCDCYFTGWIDYDNDFSTNDPTYTFTVTEDRTFYAEFSRYDIEVEAVADPVEGGSITIEGGECYGDTITISIAPNENYVFENWTENGEVVSEEPTFSFELKAYHYFVAHLSYIDGLNEGCASAKVYPNPTQGELTLEGEDLRFVRIVNVYGQTVYNAKVEGDHFHLDLSNLARGIYMMHIGTENGQAVKQIVLE